MGNARASVECLQDAPIKGIARVLFKGLLSHMTYVEGGLLLMFPLRQRFSAF